MPAVPADRPHLPVPCSLQNEVVTAPEPACAKSFPSPSLAAAGPLVPVAPTMPMAAALLVRASRAHPSGQASPTSLLRLRAHRLAASPTAPLLFPAVSPSLR